MELFYIVIYKYPSGRWTPDSSGIFTGPNAAKLARGYAEGRAHLNPTWEFRIAAASAKWPLGSLADVAPGFAS